MDGLVGRQNFGTERGWSAQYTSSSSGEQRPEVGSDLLKVTQLIRPRAEDPQPF